MPESKTCPKCGGELPINAPFGICPKCLMEAGLDSADESKAVDDDSDETISTLNGSCQYGLNPLWLKIFNHQIRQTRIGQCAWGGNDSRYSPETVKR